MLQSYWSYWLRSEDGVRCVSVEQGCLALRVLVVEPHDPSRIVLQLALRDARFVCECVTTAADAVARVAAFAPHVVIYEWHMVHGLGLPSRIRAGLSSTASTRFIALSTQDEPERFCDAEGIDAYLAKPFDAVRLRRVIMQVASCGPHDTGSGPHVTH